MATQEQRQYVGHGRKVKQYDLVNFSVCLTDIPTTSVFEYKGKQYVKLCIGAKKQADQYGKTHSVWIDTFKPEARPQKSNVEQEEANQAAANNEGNEGVDSIPF